MPDPGRMQTESTRNDKIVIVVPCIFNEWGQNMNYKGKIAAAASACFLAACSFFCMSVYGAEKPEYLKSVTYFGDEWPINYWNSEDKDMEDNFERIAEDGFNSIILVAPWREFQPNSLGGQYNEKAFERLDEVMDCAGEHGLWVILRLGYTWDYYGAAELPARFANVVQENSEDRHAWIRYSERIYETASAHENFHSGFITWEDFWAYTYNMNDDIPMSNRLRMAKKSGYIQYLKERYTLEEVSGWYGCRFISFDDVYLPYGSHPSAGLFYDFYDQFLMDLLKETQEVFPGLSMEVRADGDRVYDTEGSYRYYSHSATYPCEGAPYTALMYSVSMGQANKNDRISSETALQAMRENLSRLYGASGKKFYVEQLLYMDSTEAYSFNTQIYEDQMDDFVRNLAPVLSEHTNGYGLWVYRNYVNNCVYNSQFALEKDGWEFSGGSSVVTRNGTWMASVNNGGSIAQKLTGRLPRSPMVYVEFHAETDSVGAGVKVKLGEKEKNIRITEAGTYTAEFPWQDAHDLVITGDKRVYLDDIRVYTYEQIGRIYEKDGTEADLAGDFRILNGEIG